MIITYIDLSMGLGAEYWLGRNTEEKPQNKNESVLSMFK